MSRLCTRKLEEAEKKVELLLGVSNGEAQTRRLTLLRSRNNRDVLMHTAKDLTTYFRERQPLVEQPWISICARDKLSAIIHEAMRYSVFAGGKRLRPLLLIIAAEMWAKPVTDVLFAAAALEMIHTYSLIHDDLPALDNDDLRRGKPTSHKQYGEDIAILAGDALLTLAFQTMTDPAQRNHCTPQAILSATYELALAAGTFGMVGGQVMDMQAEKHQIQSAELEYIHSHKTGKLLTAAVRIGAILADAAPEQLAAISMYGEKIVWRFKLLMICSMSKFHRNIREACA